MTAGVSKSKMISNDDGFTLLEIIAVLVILGILAVIAVPRYIDLESNAKKKAFAKGISDLTDREILTWADQKISASGYVSDAKVFGAINYTLGPDFKWNPGDPKLSGGTMDFKGESFSLSRTASTRLQPPVWKLAP
jgi:prepilin-type N-terminal cleavage/methylation domain-containing protein